MSETLSRRRQLLIWSVFALLQTAGMLLLSFANIHSNIGPLFLGGLLLLPGSILFFLFSGYSGYAVAALALAVNAFAVWLCVRPSSARDLIRN